MAGPQSIPSEGGPDTTGGRDVSHQIPNGDFPSVTCTGVSDSCQGLGPRLPSIPREKPQGLCLSLKTVGSLVREQRGTV